MPYLFTPDQRVQRTAMAGRGLIFQFPVSQTAWRDINGVWRSAETPAAASLVGAAYVFTRPTIVADDIAAELALSGLGQLNPIEP